MNYVRAVALGDIPNEGSVAVDIGARPVLVCRSMGQIFAVANRCSHADEKLECGRVRAGWVACPAHGARFNLATGRAMNPPATKPIATYACRIEGDWVEVAVET